MAAETRSGHTNWNRLAPNLPDRRSPLNGCASLVSCMRVGSWSTIIYILFCSGRSRLVGRPSTLRFELLTGAVEPGRMARVYLVPFIGAACVVVGFEQRDWGPVGGGRERCESVRAALERELWPRRLVGGC